MMKLRRLSTIALGILLTGCMVGPDYEAPDMQASEQWHAPKNISGLVNERVPVRSDWWRVFQDRELTGLIEMAAKNNLDVKIANARIREARAMRRVAKAGFFPNLGLGVTATREGISENAFAPAGISLDRDYYDAGFDASWELDLFGKTRRSVEVANAQIGSAIESQRDTLVQVLAEVARSYITLRGAQQQAIVARNTLKVARQQLGYLQAQFRVGHINQKSVISARARVNQLASELPSYQTEIRQQAYRLAVLVGKKPDALLSRLLVPKPIPGVYDIVPIGLPSDLLKRRPDIRQAERSLAAATAAIGMKKADLFPSFSLTGNFGFESFTFGDLYRKNSTAWAIGPTLNIPIFQGNSIRAQVKAQEMEAKAASLTYRQTVLNAVADTKTALTRYGEAVLSRGALDRAWRDQLAVVDLTKARVSHGEDDMLSLLDARSLMLERKAAYLNAEISVLTDLVSLYKALGGGWDAFSHPAVAKGKDAKATDKQMPKA